MKSTNRISDRSLVVGLLVVVVALVVGVLVVKISSVNGGTSEQKAQQLVASTHRAGIAPHLTAGVAEALYGSSAPSVCRVLEGGLTTAEKNDLVGNSSNKRPKTITTDAVTYGRLVVQTYCPGELSQYNKLVDHLNPVKSSG
jgi:hypothetical protein